jgi:hypothetical protein
MEASMKKLLSYCACVLALWFVSMCATYSQDFPRSLNPTQPVEPFPFAKIKSHDLNFVRTSPVSFYKRKAEWRKIVDEFWGPGLPLAEKQNVFQIYADYVRATNPTLGYSGINWDSVSGYWRQKITDSTSRGGFSAILSRLALSLHDIHARATDSVMLNTPLNPGTPILVAVPWDISHFGAGLSVLPDSSLLVYSAVSNHPLGLEPGDIVLGYEGVPWRYLVRELLAAELPMNFRHGSTPSAFAYSLLSCAGQNWHLFDTIDVMKYKTGTTVHLPTDFLTTLNVTTPMVNNAQMQIPGVPMPVLDWNQGAVKYGIVAGTNVGYIYVYHHSYAGVSAEFAAAVSALKGSNGLIIDIRFNFGGSYGLNAGIDQLMNPGTQTLVSLRRCDASDLWSLCEVPTFNFSIPNNYTNIYDRPIAVLLGPACVSFGDYSSWELSYIPGAHFFGKSPMAAYTGWWNAWWTGGVTYGPRVRGFDLISPNFTVVDHRFPNEPRWGKEFPLDEEVWLTRDGVAKGEDDVVKRAIQWINSQSSVHDVSAQNPYVRPGVDSITITAMLTNPGNHSMAASLIMKNLTGVVQDSTAMMNDGLHGDGLPGDSILGARFRAPSSEGFYTIDLRTHDSTTNFSRLLPAVSLMTTAGPVENVGDTSSAVPQWGLTVGFRLKVSNNGTTASTPAIGGRIRTLDTAATIASSDPSFTVGDIAPGQVRLSSPIRIAFSTWCTGTRDIRFELLFSSNATQYWRDTITIRVVDPTGFAQEQKGLPNTYELGQNYPNPFNPNTTIQYALPTRTHITLTVYNTLGQVVRELVNGDIDAGYHSVGFDASGVTSGAYFYRLRAGDFVQARSLLLLK